MTEVLQEKSLQHEAEEEVTIITEPTPFSELDERVQLALQSASEKKASNTIVLDLRQVADFTEFFVVLSASNTRQAQAIADNISEQLKILLDSRVSRIEGYNTAEWILLDYGDFLVHIFDEKAREVYDLERLWRDARRVELPSELKS